MVKCFVDSDIWVAAADFYDPQKKQQARFFLQNIARESLPVISVQVTEEFFSACVSRFGCDKTKVRQMLHLLTNNIETVNSSPDLCENAVLISAESGLRYWDAAIVAAAEQARCARIYSERIPTGLLVRGIRVVNPFTLSKAVPNPISLF